LKKIAGWPHKDIDYKPIAEAGFYFAPTPDRPDRGKCYACQLMFSNWQIEVFVCCCCCFFFFFRKNLKKLNIKKTTNNRMIQKLNIEDLILVVEK